MLRSPHSLHQNFSLNTKLFLRSSSNLCYFSSNLSPESNHSLGFTLVDSLRPTNLVSLRTGNRRSSSLRLILSPTRGALRTPTLTAEEVKDVPMPMIDKSGRLSSPQAARELALQYFVDADDSVPEKVVVHKDGPRGIHFRRAGPRQKVYFESDEVHACIVTCGGLCPGLNTVIREVVSSLSYMYGVKRILGIDGGYRGFYAKNTIPLNSKVVNDIHKRGGTILGTSRGGHDTTKIVDSIQDQGQEINCVEII